MRIKNYRMQCDNKVLFVLTYYYPSWTGLTAYAQRVAEGLAKRGHTVTVLTTRHNKSLSSVECYQGVKIIRVKPFFKISRSLIAPGIFFSLIKLRKEYDVVSIYLPYSGVLPATLICRLLDKKVYFTDNGDLGLPKGLFNWFLKKAYYWLTFFAAKISHGLVVQTEDRVAHSKLLSQLTDKLYYIYAPVKIPPPRFDQVKKWKTQLGIKDKNIVGIAGRFVEEKGFDYFLKGIPLVLKVFPDTIFLFAGETNVDYENFYQKCLPLIEKNKKHIKLLGLIRSRQKMANFYNLLDVFVISSRNDCFPSTQIEAMLCGTPVICTNIPGAREVVRKTNMGVLVKPCNYQSLAAGIIEVLGNRRRYLKFQSKANEVFDWKQSVEKYERLFED